MTATSFDISMVPAPGLTVIEASAGTGKTFSLAALTVNAIADGRITARELCTVTFTEAATAELRSRLRRRIARGVALLDDPAVVADPAAASLVDRDPVDQLLLTGSADDRRARHERLVAALTDVDAATVSTIHGFCQRLLAIAGAPQADITTDADDVADVVRDLVLAAGLSDDDVIATVDLKRFIAAVSRRLANPEVAMLADDHPVTAAVAHAVDQAVERVRATRSHWGRRTFDSMLVDAHEVLHDPTIGPRLITELRSRYGLVMIDEFQDTNVVQWEIFRTAFLDPAFGPATPVVVVGDPKQSIYRFRGAELSAYLAAVNYATTTGGVVTTLSTNWRSDQGLLRGLDAMMAGVTFGDPSVVFQSVDAGRAGESGVVDPRSSSPFIIRALGPVEPGGKITADPARELAVDDLVAEVTRHLCEVTIAGDDGAPRRVRPDDIGILVRSNNDAVVLASALRGAGVPVSVSGGDSVVNSAGGRHWAALIAAMQRPTSPSSARRVALSIFGGMTADEVAHLTDDGQSAITEWLRGLVDDLQRGGLPRCMGTLRQRGYARRLLATIGGERDLTDIDHIAELMQRATGGRGCSPVRLAAVLNDLAGVSGDPVLGEAVDRRLDRDDDTVKIMTVHKAKGLEFPVVMCPLLWTSADRIQGTMVHAHVATGVGGHRLIDTGWVYGSATASIDSLAKGEEEAEAFRLLYVAVTRAAQRLVLWEVPAYTWRFQPLRKIFAQTCDNDLVALAARSDGAVDVQVSSTAGTVVDVAVDAVPDTNLAAATFDRELTTTWRVWSFSSINRAVDDDRHHGIVEPPVVTGGLDEPTDSHSGEGAHPLAPAGPTPDETESATTLRTVPGSAAFGTLVHRILEVTDFTAADLNEELLDNTMDAMRYRRMPMAPQQLAAGLSDAVRAPLGGPLGGHRLADISRGDRRDELDFLFPLAAMSAADIARIVSEGLALDDPLAGWFRAAADGVLHVDIEGMLTGSIDLVARVDGRYVVADYKTNRISDNAAFTQAEMIGEMERHGYPLQAVLYLVALRRYLTFRLPEVDVDDCIGGAAYLFVRGMTPTSTPVAVGDQVPGVMWWTPPPTVIAQLDAEIAPEVRRGR